MYPKGSNSTNTNYRWDDNDKGVIGPPLDFSFMKIAKFDDLTDKNLQSVRTGKVPKRADKNRYETNSLWLGNNSIKSIENLKGLVNKFLVKLDNLNWLDLSFNTIDKIDDEIAEFKNLKILYLHGNKISDMNEILKLRKLLKLRTLTLHGNPIETIPNYRGFIITILPRLLNLDFSPVISEERKRALPVGFFKVIKSHE